MRVVVLFEVAIMLVTSGIASAAPRYTDWSTPVWLGPAINSTASDSGPAFSKDGLTLYITSTRAGGSGSEDIWVSYREMADATWSTPLNIPALNSSGFDRVPALSRDGHWMFFGRGDASTPFDLWASYRQNTHEDFGAGGWQAPTPVTSLNTPAQDVAPAYCEDASGQAFLFFASDRAGGSGGFDLYVATRLADGSWGDVQNIVELNSSGVDSRPTLSHNCMEVIFQSDRTSNLDLYSATRDSSTSLWSNPTPLTTINSAAIDGQPALSADGETLYFTSSRSGGLGSLDLWMSTRAKMTGKP